MKRLVRMEYKTSAHMNNEVETWKYDFFIMSYLHKKFNFFRLRIVLAVCENV